MACARPISSCTTTTKLQKIDRDIAFLPMSMVICIQRSANVEAVLPKIRKIGTELTTC